MRESPGLPVLAAILSMTVFAASSCAGSQESREPTTPTPQPTTTASKPTTTPPTTTTPEPGAHRIAFTRDSYSEVWVMDADGGNQRPLTDKVSSSDPAWSPDGTRITFTSQSYDSYYSEIYVADANGANLQQLTNDYRDHNPAWSPDGTLIAFLSDGALFAMDSEGTNVQRLTEDECAYRGPEWSPDGARLAFTTCYNNEILVVGADGGNRQSLGESEHGSLAWSPDGTHVAFINKQRLFVAHAESADLRQLTDNYYDKFPAWSPDGSRIAFQSQLTGHSTDYEVFVINVDSYEQQQLTYANLAQQNNKLVYWRLPVWSPDGKHIAFQSDGDEDGDLEIYVMDATGGNMKQLTHNDYEDRSPIWSPDGKHIAFQSRVGGEQEDWEIFVADLGTGTTVQLTDNPYDDTEPVWSPDSTFIAFTQSYPLQRYDMNSDGADQQFRSFSVTPLHEYPRFYTQQGHYARQGGLSPDRTRIIFQKDWQFFVADADRSNPQKLPHNNTHFASPAWSPDSRHIAFFSSHEGDDQWGFDVFLVDSDGDNLQQLADNRYADTGPSCTPPRYRYRGNWLGLACDTQEFPWGGGPAWSPDGSHIAYTSPRDGYMEVFVVGTDGTDQKQLTRNPHLRYPKGWTADRMLPADTTHLVWSSDSRRILFASNRDGDYEIYLVNADGSGLVQLTNNHYDDRYPRWVPSG